jgi:hypothetical protein
VALQVLRMRQFYPHFRESWNDSGARWIGIVRPTELSDVYETEVFYRFERAPRVRVINPALRKRSDGAPIPHRYAGGYLCLYFDRAQEWTPAMFIADTIIPWTSLWLLYYELWHATGEWLGGGVPLRTATRPQLLFRRCRRIL